MREVYVMREMYVMRIKMVFHRITVQHLLHTIMIKVFVAPDIAAALKTIIDCGKKNRFLASCSFRKNVFFFLRSRHLVLWSLGTLTGQQRFYGTGLVT
jgi:hypothetical protein